MKIDELVANLEKYADDFASGMGENYPITKDIRKAAETIKLLWEIARENNLAKYKRQIDEMRGADGNT